MRLLPMFLALVSLIAAPASAQEAQWAAPSGAYRLNYASDGWVTVPNRSAGDQHVLRLVPRDFDPSAPKMCNARHYQLNPGPGWEPSFPQWARDTADGINEQNAAQILSLPAGRIDRVEHIDVGQARIADVYVSGLPLGGVTFNSHYRVFAVRGASGPIIVQVYCQASQALGPEVFRELETITNSLQVPG